MDLQALKEDRSFVRQLVALLATLGVLAVHRRQVTPDPSMCLRLPSLLTALAHSNTPFRSAADSLTRAQQLHFAKIAQCCNSGTPYPSADAANQA